jgi:hypothetical protein
MGGSDVSHFGGKSLDTAHGGHTPQIRPYATAEPPPTNDDDGLEENKR